MEMTGEADAAGEIVTGALWARTVGGAADSHGEHGSQCLNCGTALIGSHCHACGQSGHIHRSIGAIGHDIAHGVLHVEGKIWRTLPMLAFRPGELTRRYVAGERMRFLSPLGLFLFSVFLMFATISLLGAEIMPGSLTEDQTGVATARVDAQARDASARLAEIERQRAAAARDGRTVTALDEEHAAIRATLKGLKAAQTTLKGIGTTQMGMDAAGKSGIPPIKTGNKRLDKGIAKATDNPSLLIYKLQSSAYKFSWALIPLSLPFVWLLFVWRRGFRMYDHAMFVTYSLSFMTLLVIALTVAGVLGLNGDLIAFAAILIPPLHMYKQLRGAYRLGRFSALWRTIFLISFAFVALIFFLLMLLGMGLMG